MHNNIFVNLPVSDLPKAKAFFEALGYSFNKQFTDESAGALVLGDNLYAMLLTREKAKQFTKKDIADAHTTTEVLIALSVESKEEVDQLVEKAITAGGSEAREKQDYGFMYARSFEDLDGHIWEILWIDPNFIQK